jgi:hypothetical protein
MATYTPHAIEHARHTMTPGKERQAWKSHPRFPHSQTIDGDWINDLTLFSTCQVCWRTMRWHNGRTRRTRNLLNQTRRQRL